MSKGTTNQSTLSFLNSYPGSRDNDPQMHVSDRGHLVSVGELGNLSLGGRFSTIRLCDGGSALRRPVKLLRYFTLSTNDMRQGLVNVNTRSVPVLAGVFDGMPLGYPESLRHLSYAEAEAVASAVIAGGPYTNVDEIGNLSCWTTNLSPWSEWTDTEKESILAHSIGLIGTRQQLFTVIARGLSYSDGIAGIGGVALAQADLVAEVWRDPFPDAAGYHDIFIRTLLWQKDMMNYHSGTSCVALIAQDLSQAVTDGLTLPCLIGDGASEVSFCTITGIPSPSIPFCARRVGYWKSGGNLYRQEDIFSGTWSNVAPSIVASNLSHLVFHTSDGGSYLNSLPSWVDIEVGLNTGEAVTQRVEFLMPRRYR